MVENLVDRVVGVINEADEETAVQRVAELRAKYAGAAPDALVGMLVKQKCLQAGAIGTVTSSASVIPGIGVFVSLVFGVAADIVVTAKMQAELVLEIAAAYGQHLSEAEKQSALVMVKGMSAGANQLLEAAGQDVAHRVNGHLDRQSAIRAIPILDVAAPADDNILFTYLIGQRTIAYFRRAPEAVGFWKENLRALAGVNEDKVIAWLAETTGRSWRLVGDGALTAGSAVITAGRAGVSAAGAGRGVARGAEAAAGVVFGAGKAAGEGVTFGVEKVAKVATGAGREVVRGAGVVVGVGKAAGEGVVSGAGKVTEIAAGVWKPDRSGQDDHASGR